ncbi:MAG: GAF domain-containing protein [Anaerolineales bacterium]|nr:GAF domain-containing protein [Anaerolineales bacterium]
MPRVHRVADDTLENQLHYLPGTVSRLGGILQAFADLTVLLDLDGTVLEYRFDTPHLQNRFPDLLLNRRFQNLLSSEVALRFDRQLLQVRESGELLAFEFSLQPSEEQWFDARIGLCSDSQLVLVAREITDHKRLESKLGQQVRRLAALRSIDLAIASGLDLKLLLSILLDQVANLLHVDAGSIWLVNPETNQLAFSSGMGFNTNAVQSARLRLGEGLAGQVALERKSMIIPDLRLNIAGSAYPPHFADEQFLAYYGLPLVAKGKTLGVFEIYNRAPLRLDADWVEFLNVLSGQAAIAIDNAILFQDLQRSNVELSLAYDATIEGWARTLDLRDRGAKGHTSRVVDITTQLALSMGVEKDSLIHVRRGAILHDIGKVAIPDEILFKPGPLTDAEWQIMQQHPTLAVNLLAPISYLAPALDIPRWHHERWDGSGYPERLRGEQIPFAARLFAIADVYDALVSDRPYRKAWSQTDAIQYIESQSGKQFDPRVVVEFMKLTTSNGYAASR